jgi:hypothetical protein
MHRAKIRVPKSRPTRVVGLAPTRYCRSRSVVVGPAGDGAMNFGKALFGNDPVGHTFSAISQLKCAAGPQCG